MAAHRSFYSNLQSNQAPSNKATKKTTSTMSPLDSAQNDEYFLSLVQSQRQLLNQLNMETAMRREQQAHGVPRPSANLTRGGSLLGVNHDPFTNHPFVDRRNSLFAGHPSSFMNQPPNHPQSWMNQPPMPERRPSIDMAFSKRLSLGMGSEAFMLPPMFPELEKTDIDDASVKGSDMDYGDLLLRKMKRRRSSMGLSVFLDDPKQGRRLSMLSTISKPLDSSTDGEEDISTAFEQAPPPPPPPVEEPPKKKVRLDPNVDVPTLKKKLGLCADAMEKSAKSQQDIHDWDRKMGLKRSHSKTMRESARTRKKLRAVFKKQINRLTT